MPSTLDFLPSHTHSPLQLKGMLIRLFDIRPALDPQSPINGELSVHDLNAHPSYIALSYVCGDPGIMIPIFVDRQRLNITQNCHAALIRLRQMGLSHVWVDSICVNQRDNDEKSAQVLLMKDIYSKARKVIIFLGYNETDAHPITEIDEGLAFELIEELAGRGDGDFNAIFKQPIGFVEEYTKERWDCFLRFFIHPWFRRVWTFAEAMMSKPDSLIISTARRTIGYSQLSSALEEFAMLTDEQYSETQLPVDKAMLHNFIHYFIPASFFVKVVTERQELQGDKSLYHHMSLAHRYDCHNPQDRVYPILGLIEKKFWHRIKVDYSKSLVELYMAVAEAVMLADQSPCLIRHAGFSNIPKSNRIPWLVEWPSWVPDWRMKPKDQPWQMHYPSYSATPADGAANFSVLFDSKTLEVQGLEIDAVLEHTGPLSHERESLTKKSGAVGLRLWYKQFEYEPQRDTHPGLGWVRTITMDMDGSTKDMSKFGAGKQSVEVRNRYYALWKTSEAGKRPEWTWHGTFRMDEIPNVMYDEDDENDIRQKRAWEKWIVETACDFTRAVTMATNGRKFFTTRRRRMGLGPVDLCEQDRLFLIKGCNVPVLLRHYSGDSYSVVGECFVHGVMYGESVPKGGALESQPRKQKQQWRRIQLV